MEPADHAFLDALEDHIAAGSDGLPALASWLFLDVPAARLDANIISAAEALFARHAEPSWHHPPPLDAAWFSIIEHLAACVSPREALFLAEDHARKGRGNLQAVEGCLRLAAAALRRESAYQAQRAAAAGSATAWEGPRPLSGTLAASLCGSFAGALPAVVMGSRGARRGAASLLSRGLPGFLLATWRLGARLPADAATPLRRQVIALATVGAGVGYAAALAAAAQGPAAAESDCCGSCLLRGAWACAAIALELPDVDAACAVEGAGLEAAVAALGRAAVDSGALAGWAHASGNAVLSAVWAAQSPAAADAAPPPAMHGATLTKLLTAAPTPRSSSGGGAHEQEEEAAEARAQEAAFESLRAAAGLVAVCTAFPAMLASSVAVGTGGSCGHCSSSGCRSLQPLPAFPAPVSSEGALQAVLPHAALLLGLEAAWLQAESLEAGRTVPLVDDGGSYEDDAAADEATDSATRAAKRAAQAPFRAALAACKFGSSFLAAALSATPPSSQRPQQQWDAAASPVPAVLLLLGRAEITRGTPLPSSRWFAGKEAGPASLGHDEGSGEEVGQSSPSQTVPPTVPGSYSRYPLLDTLRSFLLVAVHVEDVSYRGAAARGIRRLLAALPPPLRARLVTAALPGCPYTQVTALLLDELRAADAAAGNSSTSPLLAAACASTLSWGIATRVDHGLLGSSGGSAGDGTPAAAERVRAHLAATSDVDLALLALARQLLLRHVPTKTGGSGVAAPSPLLRQTLLTLKRDYLMPLQHGIRLVERDANGGASAAAGGVPGATPHGHADACTWLLRENASRVLELLEERE